MATATCSFFSLELPRRPPTTLSTYSTSSLVREEILPYEGMPVYTMSLASVLCEWVVRVKFRVISTRQRKKMSWVVAGAIFAKVMDVKSFWDRDGAHDSVNPIHDTLVTNNTVTLHLRSRPHPTLVWLTETANANNLVIDTLSHVGDLT